MTSRNFVYWLQGYFEISEAVSLSPKETLKIKNHLAMVFKHEIDPSMGKKEHQDLLKEIHDGMIPKINC